MKGLILTLALALSGCATLERHPVLTAVGTAIIIGSVALSLQHDQRQPNRCVDAPNRSNAVIGSCVGVL